MPIIIPRRERLLLPPSNPPEYAIGIDPGENAGAVALLRHRDVLFLGWWQKGQNGFSGVSLDEGATAPRLTRSDSLWGLLGGFAMPRPRSAAVALEFVRQLPGHSHTEVLVESAGYLRAWLDAQGLGTPQRPTSAEWRRDVLGVQESSGAKACGLAALAAYADDPAPGSREFVRWGLTSRPVGVPVEHAAEAVAMALWAAGYRLAP